MLVTGIELNDIIDALPGLAWTAFSSGLADYLGVRWREYTGLSAEECVGEGWLRAVHPEDIPHLLEVWVATVASERLGECEARMRGIDGNYRWFMFRACPIADESGQIVRWLGMNFDLEETKQAEAKLAAEKALLESVAKDEPLPDVLAAVCRRFEELVPGSLCSILLVDPDKTTFRLGAAPSLPDDYNAALDGAAIDRDAGPCALAVAGRVPVLTIRPEQDARWKGSAWSQLIARHSLQSCRAAPILSGAGDVLGAFTVLRGEPVEPATAAGIDLIDRFSHIIGIAVDRARATAALQAGDAELREAYRHLTEAQRLSHTGSFTADLVIDAHSWSDEFYRIAELKLGTPIRTHTLQDLVHPEDVAMFDAAVREGLEGGEPNFMFRIVTASGALKHLRGVARVTGQSEGHPILMGAVQDVTENWIAQEAVKASETELRRAYAHLTEAQQLSNTGSFTADLVADEHVWSDELYRVFGADPAEKPTLQSVAELIHPEDLPIYLAELKRGLAGHDLDFVFRIVTPQGAVKHLHAAARVSEQIAGRPVFRGAVQDVTESKVAEEALNRARAELAHMARVTTLSALTASIAHEINQPLAGIITNASTCVRMLAADPPDIEGARATAQRTIRDGNRASEVIKRLRGLFARSRPKREPVDLNDAAQEVLALTAVELRQRGVTLRSTLADGLPEIVGDRVQLQQVILNLVLNACDAMSEVENRPREVTVTTAADAGGVTVSVCDAGTGIDPHNVEVLFDAFHTTKAAGMGVGLSISKSIVEAHDGRIWAAANDGPGATFAFSIPR